MLLRLIPDYPAGSSLTIVNGSVVTGYSVLNTIDFGNAAWQHALSGARGTQGARPAAGEPDNRVVQIPVHVGPSGTVDAFNLKAALLAETVDDLRRFGGQIQYQLTQQSVRQYLEVMTCGITRESWGRRGAKSDVGDVVIIAQCAPYMLGDPMDTLEAFVVDSVTAGDWTFDVANAGAGALSVAGGKLVPGATGLKRVRHTVKGYSYADVQVTLMFTTGPTLTNGVWGVTARADVAGADTLLAAEVAAGTNVVRVAQYVGGSQVTTDTTAFTPAANTTYWVRLRLEGNIATAEVFTAPPPFTNQTPSPTSTPSASISRRLTASESARFYSGHAGLRITAADTAERYGPFQVEPYTYRLLTTPEHVRLGGRIPGDVSAMADVTVSAITGGVASSSPIWGLVSWFERPLASNLIYNGDFEISALGATGWSTAGVASVIGAATSILRVTTAGVKYGNSAASLVTPATTDTGAAFFIPRRFKAGRTYALLVWLSSVAQTTATRVKLGNAADLAVGTAVNLSTTPKVYSVTWAPTADAAFAYAVIGVNAATASTIILDGAVVVESPPVALSVAQASTSSTSFPVYATPSETPNLLADGSLGAPFLVMIDQEIIRVTAISADGKTWTGDRGAEGSIAATHLIDSRVIILPPLRPQYEGKGVASPFGIVECEQGATVFQITTIVGGGSVANAADATARSGTLLRWTLATSGYNSLSTAILVDPNTLVPDDYTLGEVDVEVWLREQWSQTITGARVTISTLSELGLALGPERFTREFGSIGKLPTPATSKQWRFHRLGVIPMVVDLNNPQRWRVQILLEGTGAAGPPTWDLDYFLLVPVRGRRASPTGEINDTAASGASYPAFFPFDSGWTATGAASKTLRADGSSIVQAPGAYGYPDAGMGDVIELPDTDVDMIVKLSNLVPDDPTSDASAETVISYSTSLHAAVTPRYIFARSA